MNDRLNVQAIFDSIDGEENGFRGAGELTTFIRLKGCNLNCQWCDTKYAQESKPENWMTLDEIIELVHFPKVTITGGEPLLKKAAVEKLCSKLIYSCHNGHPKISIETNGSIEPTYFTHSIAYIVDYKLPSSGMMGRMNSLAFSSLRPCDVIKFVISDMENYNYAKMLISEHDNWQARKVFSPAIEIKQVTPIFDKVYNAVDITWPRQLAEMMIRDEVNAQFSLQIHKILWPGSKEER